jgi:hypothetical protein
MQKRPSCRRDVFAAGNRNPHRAVALNQNTGSQFGTRTRTALLTDMMIVVQE